MYDTFTGFKYIAEKIAEQEQLNHTCIFSFEESIGYLIGDHCRDKDAITASMLFAEMGAYYLDKDMSLFEAVDELYRGTAITLTRRSTLCYPDLTARRRWKVL